MIKPLLLLGLAMATIVMMRGQRPALQMLVRRILTVAGLAAAALSVLFPSVVTLVAHLVGVGRGADLVLYVLAVSFVFTTVVGALTTRRLEDRLVELTRAHAFVQGQLDERRLQERPHSNAP